MDSMRKFYCFAVLALIPLGIAVTLIRGELTSAAETGRGGRGNTPLTQRTPETPTGGRGISPHLNSVPAFTEEDVRQFVNDQGTVGMIDVTGPISIIGISFLTAQEVQQRIPRSSPSVPDN